jgi:hypothetical protein
MNSERGRENGSFPVAEILKPLGFKAQAFRASSETLAFGSNIGSGVNLKNSASKSIYCRCIFQELI